MNAPLHPLSVPAASNPARLPRATRLLHVDPVQSQLAALPEAGLAAVLRPGDLLVLNDASTLPALLRLEEGGELRLLGRRPSGGWWAVELGRGSWRDDTDHRPPPPDREPGDRLPLVYGGEVHIEALHPRLARVRAVRFAGEGSAGWTSAVYRAGHPVQYSYMDRDVPLAAIQTGLGGCPWAVEMPSAGRLVPWRVLDDLTAQGVGIARLTHAAGLSATGDPELDPLLPLPERFRIPAETLEAVHTTRQAGGRVVAVGTSVVRALEGSHLQGEVLDGVTDLRLGPSSELHRVDGVVTNVHLPGESHFELLQAFAPRDLLVRAARESAQRGFLSHEFGDGWLILGPRSA